MLFLGESRFLLSSDVTVVVVHPVDGPLVLLVKEETFEFERGAKLATLDAQVPTWEGKKKSCSMASFCKQRFSYNLGRMVHFWTFAGLEADFVLTSSMASFDFKYITGFLDVK